MDIKSCLKNTFKIKVLWTSETQPGTFCWMSSVIIGLSTKREVCVQFFLLWFRKKRNKTFLRAMKYQHVTSSHKLMWSHLEHSSITSYKSFFKLFVHIQNHFGLNLLQKFQRFLNCPSALNHKAVEWSALCNNHKHMTVISGHCGDSLRIYS